VSGSKYSEWTTWGSIASSFLFSWKRGGGVLSVGIKWLGCEVNHLPSGAEVKTDWSYTFAPSLCLHDVDRDMFTLLKIWVCDSYQLSVWNHSSSL
jgi:hypothetical protein